MRLWQRSTKLTQNVEEQIVGSAAGRGRFDNPAPLKPNIARRNSIHLEGAALLVYLDSAHLALLDRAATSERDLFLSVWRSCKCELALSLHHLQEIAQLSDRASAERRLQVLKRFPSVRCKPAGVDLVLRLEIQLQLYRLLGFSPDVRRSATETLFPQATYNEVRVATISFQPLFKRMRIAHEMGANASSTSTRAVQAAKAGNMRRRVDPAILDFLGADEMFEEALASSPPDVGVKMRQVYAQVRNGIQNHGNLRRALEDIYGIASVEFIDEIADDDLAAVSLFFASARSEVPAVFDRVGADPSDSEHLVQRMDPYAAPGFSLQLAVQRARKRHPMPDKPGDEIDVAHVGFAPYVDLLLVDKRTFGFAVQEARDDPKRLASDRLNTIRQAGTLQQAAEAIAAGATAF